jgi:ring-1,2-phenylacetyl-CoA epoxidase subunit PaaC
MIKDLTTKPLHTLLLSLADDEFILGYRNSEWTGIAPMLEEYVAFSSMSQD